VADAQRRLQTYRGIPLHLPLLLQCCACLVGVWQAL